MLLLLLITEVLCVYHIETYIEHTMDKAFVLPMPTIRINFAPDYNQYIEQVQNNKEYHIQTKFKKALQNITVHPFSTHFLDEWNPYERVVQEGNLTRIQRTFNLTQNLFSSKDLLDPTFIAYYIAESKRLYYTDTITMIFSVPEEAYHKLTEYPTIQDGYRYIQISKESLVVYTHQEVNLTVVSEFQFSLFKEELQQKLQIFQDANQYLSGNLSALLDKYCSMKSLDELKLHLFNVGEFKHHQQILEFEQQMNFHQNKSAIRLKPRPPTDLAELEEILQSDTCQKTTNYFHKYFLTIMTFFGGVTYFSVKFLKSYKTLGKKWV